MEIGAPTSTREDRFVVGEVGNGDRRAHEHEGGPREQPITAQLSRARSDVVATLEVDPRFAAGLKDIELYSHLIVLYWLDRSRRDLVLQVPSHVTAPRGVFALRSPVRPNPIGLAVVELVSVDGTSIKVRNLDCCDGTPLLDIKPYYASLDSEPAATRP